MNIRSALPLFVSMLQERLASGALVTEDSVRYTFYAALLKLGVPHVQVVLEYPHPSVSRAKIDTIVLGAAESESSAIEFKYHQRLRSGHSQPRPMQAGQLLADVFRLARVPREVAARRYLVYVTDDEMADYFRNRSNHLSWFFDGFSGKRSLGPTSFTDWCDTLRAQVHSVVCECRVSLALATELSKTTYIRVYEVFDAGE